MPTSIKDKILNKLPKKDVNNSDTIQTLDAKANAQVITPDNNNPNVNDDLLPEEISPETGKTGQFGYENYIEAERFSGKAPQKFGSSSIFNPYAVFTHPDTKDKNDFLDLKGKEGIFPKGDKVITSSDGKTTHLGGRNLTLDALLEDFSPDREKTKPYFATDFLFDKYYNRIPLNHLITLRRFVFPTYDNLNFGKENSSDQERKISPIAQAVTYFGEPTGNSLKDISKFAGHINWEELTADVHDVEGNERSADDTPFFNKLGKTGGNVVKGLGALGSPGKQDIGGFKQESIEAERFNSFEYTNKVLGPVNVIHKTHTRGRGIGADWKYDLVFNYELKSYNNINPRIAAVDLLCNMLALSFNNAKFWGGANRYFPNQPQFGFVGDEAAFYRGDYGGYVGSVISQLGSGLGAGIGILGNLVSSILGGNLGGLANIAKGGASVLFDLQRQKSRPKVLGFHALLTGLPVGEWHMTVGNPYRPIMSMGNLICEGFDFEMGEHLGVDDFPSELKFTIKLKQGRPRDKGDLESVFNQGEGRIYHPAKGLIDVNNTSSSTTNDPAKQNINNKSTKGTKPSQTIVGDQLKVTSKLTNKMGVHDDYVRKLTGTAF